jgi:hypothetical protein
MFFLIVLFTQSICNAHDNSKFGFKAGLNYSGPVLISENYDPGTGYQLGVFSDIKIYKPISVQFEFLFAKSNYKNKYNAIPYDYYKISGTCINFPVLLKVKVFTPLSVYVGGQIGFRTDCSSQVDESRLSEPLKVPDQQILNLLAGLSLQPHKNFGMDIRLFDEGRWGYNFVNPKGLECFITYTF